jgi:hypothetical protein
MEMHLSYFSTQTLRCMLEKAHFQWKTGQPQGRYLRLGYLISRFQPFAPGLIALVSRWVEKTGIQHLPVAINLGDLITVYARKPMNETHVD